MSELAGKVADRVAVRLGDEDSVSTVSGGQQPYAGLVRGSSGPALLFIRLFEQSGELSRHQRTDQVVHVRVAAVEGHAAHAGAFCHVGEGCPAYPHLKNTLTGGVEQRVVSVTLRRHV